MTQYEKLYVDKSSGFADTLVAFGLMRQIAALFFENSLSCHLQLKDAGMYYEIQVQPALMLPELAQPTYPAKAISTAKTQLPPELLSFSYEEEKEKVTTYFEARKRGNSDLPPPLPHWDVLRAINPGALSGYNNLMQAWHSVAGKPEVLQLLFDVFASTPNEIEGALDRWKQLDKKYDWGIDAKATCQQLYNPESGKGQNKVKSNGLSIGNMENFWLLEWLKAVGFWEGALTRLLRGTKDRKTLVLAPRELTFDAHRAIMNEFVETMQIAEASTRFDILAVIRYLQALLRYFRQDESRLARLLKNRHIKKRLVSGFYTAFYKDMGNASATMNLSFVGFPGWVTIASREDVVLYSELLDELEKVVRQFDESHSDAFTLLQHLRDFVSGDDLQAFFRFTNAFPAYYMGMRERNKYAYPLSTDLIERLIMSAEKPLMPILENPGFQNIAYAIRQATVTAQYRKKQGERKYDVRYGLGQELARKARYRAEFAAALSDFLHKYNAENAQVMETRSAPYRRSIQTSDIEAIVQLIDEYGSETVANLLIAYGYARIPRDGEIQDDDLPAEDTQEEME